MESIKYQARSEYPAQSQEAAVLTVIQSLLDAIPSGELKKLIAPVIPSGGAQTIHNGEFAARSIQSLCEMIVAMPGEKAEVFIDPEIRIDRSGRLAMVWARNEIMIDGQVVIEGTNAISLHKIEGSWKVSSISDVSAPVEGMKEDVTKMYESEK